jgi:hypothetical protein
MIRLLLSLFALAACAHAAARGPASTQTMAPSSVELGTCADPTRDGVVSEHPHIERADRDLDGDGVAEIVTVDRARCTGDRNCYWNVFVKSDACARYVGTFAAAALETLASKGDGGASDVRAYWNQSGDRVLLQTYRFVRGGYQLVDVLQCKRAADDRLECADEGPVH